MPYDFELYSRISALFYKILLSHADRLQPISVDECYIEVSSQVPPLTEDVEASHAAAINIAESIRDDVRAATGCEVSVGISHNMVLARIATTRAKPASSFQLLPDEVESHLAPLEVEQLPGVGWSQADKLEQQLGIKTLAQLKDAGRGKLQACLGENVGIKVFNFACGVDARPLEPPGPRKSVSVELNYAIRFVSDDEVQVRRSLRFAISVSI
jgi:DNA repair protein REV1